MAQGLLHFVRDLLIRLHRLRHLRVRRSPALESDHGFHQKEQWSYDNDWSENDVILHVRRYLNPVSNTRTMYSHAILFKRLEITITKVPTTINAIIELGTFRIRFVLRRLLSSFALIMSQQLAIKPTVLYRFVFVLGIDRYYILTAPCKDLLIYVFLYYDLRFWLL